MSKGLDWCIAQYLQRHFFPAGTGWNSGYCREDRYPHGRTPKGWLSDVTKNSSDIDNYEAEFNDLREQLYDLTQSEFNNIRLFGDWNADGANPARSGTAFSATETLNVIISEDGTTNVLINRSLWEVH